MPLLFAYHTIRSRFSQRHRVCLACTSHSQHFNSQPHLPPSLRHVSSCLQIIHLLNWEHFQTWDDVTEKAQITKYIPHGWAMCTYWCMLESPATKNQAIFFKSADDDINVTGKCLGTLSIGQLSEQYFASVDLPNIVNSATKRFTGTCLDTLLSFSRK